MPVRGEPTLVCARAEGERPLYSRLYSEACPCGPCTGEERRRGSVSDEAVTSWEEGRRGRKGGAE